MIRLLLPVLSLASLLGAQTLTRAYRELEALQQQRDKAAATAVAPIDARFKALLKPLLTKATQQGDFETAQKITALLAGDNSPASPQKSAAKLSGAGQIKAALDGSMWKCTTGTILSGWTMQLRPDGNISLTKPTGADGWDQWLWFFDDDGKLVFKVPNQEKTSDVRLSKDLNRLTLFWEGSQIFTRLDGKP